jgi:hypothetical protein
MKTLKKMVVITICIANAYSANSQDKQHLNLVQAKETIIKKKIKDSLSNGTPMGRTAHNIIFGRSDTKHNLFFCRIDEVSFSFRQNFHKIHIPTDRHLSAFNGLDSLMFYTEMFFDRSDPSDAGYSRLIVRIFDKEILLDSIFNADKRIHSSFSGDGKYLIINTLDELPEMYNPHQDDQFIVYDVDDLRRGKVTRSVIPCQYCAFGHLVNGKLFFTQSSERDDFAGGYAWKDIYVAPWGKLKDSVRIALRSDIKAISPDGRYILAENYDLPNGVCIIIDVRKRKYQLLMGRYYNRQPAFYSYEKEKFAFDFGEHIIYVDFPESYPFDGLKNNLQFWGRSTAIRKQFQHEPLK